MPITEIISDINCDDGYHDYAPLESLDGEVLIRRICIVCLENPDHPRPSDEPETDAPLWS